MTILKKFDTTFMEELNIFKKNQLIFHFLIKKISLKKKKKTSLKHQLT